MQCETICIHILHPKKKKNKIPYVTVFILARLYIFHNTTIKFCFSSLFCTFLNFFTFSLAFFVPSFCTFVLFIHSTQYNGIHYKQLHRTAIGSPISVETVIQNTKEEALATWRETLPLWLYYIDDTIPAVHKNKIDELHEHLNKQNTSIQFTEEIEENGKIPFLDSLVTCENNTVWNTVCRKPTHTDRLLDQTILHHTKRLLHELWWEEHKLFVTYTTVWPIKLSTRALFTLRTTAQISSNAMFTSLDQIITATTHTPL